MYYSCLFTSATDAVRYFLLTDESTMMPCVVIGINCIFFSVFFSYDFSRVTYPRVDSWCFDTFKVETIIAILSPRLKPSELIITNVTRYTVFYALYVYGD